MFFTQSQDPLKSVIQLKFFSVPTTLLGFKHSATPEPSSLPSCSVLQHEFPANFSQAFGSHCCSCQFCKPPVLPLNPLRPHLRKTSSGNNTLHSLGLLLLRGHLFCIHPNSFQVIPVKQEVFIEHLPCAKHCFRP